MRSAAKPLIMTFLAFVTTLQVSCIGKGLDLSGPHYTCEDVVGTIQITKILCDGEDRTETNIYMTFDGEGSFTQDRGPNECVATFPGSYISRSGGLELYFEGNSTCSASGASVATCSFGSNTCSSGNITGVGIGFTICEFDGSKITLNRTISAEDVANDTSSCDLDQFEIIELHFI